MPKASDGPGGARKARPLHRTGANGSERGVQLGRRGGNGAVLMHMGRPGPTALVADGIAVIEGRQAAAAIGAYDVAGKLLAAFFAHYVPPADLVLFRESETGNGPDGDNHRKLVPDARKARFSYLFIGRLFCRLQPAIEPDRGGNAKKLTSSLHAMAAFGRRSTGIFAGILQIFCSNPIERFCRRPRLWGNSVSMIPKTEV